MGDFRVEDVQDKLSGLFAGGLSREDLLRAGAAEMGNVHLANLLVGSIEWDQAIGKPQNMPMADAFTVRCQYIEVVTDFEQPSGEQTIRTDLPVRLFDGKSGGGRHRVHFVVTGALEGKRHVIDVGFSSRVRWQKPARSFLFWSRRIEPPRRDFVNSQWAVDPFEVKQRFLFF